MPRWDDEAMRAAVAVALRKIGVAPDEAPIAPEDAARDVFAQRIQDEAKLRSDPIEYRRQVSAAYHALAPDDKERFTFVHESARNRSEEVRRTALGLEEAKEAGGAYAAAKIAAAPAKAVGGLLDFVPGLFGKDLGAAEAIERRLLTDGSRQLYESVERREENLARAREHGLDTAGYEKAFKPLKRAEPIAGTLQFISEMAMTGGAGVGAGKKLLASGAKAGLAKTGGALRRAEGRALIGAFGGGGKTPIGRMASTGAHFGLLEAANRQEDESFVGSATRGALMGALFKAIGAPVAAGASKLTAKIARKGMDPQVIAALEGALGRKLTAEEMKATLRGVSPTTWAPGLVPSLRASGVPEPIIAKIKRAQYGAEGLSPRVVRFMARYVPNALKGAADFGVVLPAAGPLAQHMKDALTPGPPSETEVERGKLHAPTADELLMGAILGAAGGLGLRPGKAERSRMRQWKRRDALGRTIRRGGGGDGGDGGDGGGGGGPPLPPPPGGGGGGGGVGAPIVTSPVVGVSGPVSARTLPPIFPLRTTGSVAPGLAGGMSEIEASKERLPIVPPAPSFGRSQPVPPVIELGQERHVIPPEVPMTWAGRIPPLAEKPSRELSLVEGEEPRSGYSQYLAEKEPPPRTPRGKTFSGFGEGRIEVFDEDLVAIHNSAKTQDERAKLNPMGVDTPEEALEAFGRPSFLADLSRRNGVNYTRLLYSRKTGHFVLATEDFDASAATASGKRSPHVVSTSRGNVEVLDHDAYLEAQKQGLVAPGGARSGAADVQMLPPEVRTDAEAADWATVVNERDATKGVDRGWRATRDPAGEYVLVPREYDASPKKPSTSAAPTAEPQLPPELGPTHEQPTGSPPLPRSTSGSGQQPTPAGGAQAPHQGARGAPPEKVGPGGQAKPAGRGHPGDFGAFETPELPRESRAATDYEGPPGGKRLVTARAEFTPKPTPRQLSQQAEAYLRPHQKDTVYAVMSGLEKAGSFLLASGTGSGKTATALTVATEHLKLPQSKVLIVTPSMVLARDPVTKKIGGSYAADAAALGVPIEFYRGETPGSVGPQLDVGKISVTTYEHFSAAKPHIDGKTLLIFDESHYLKRIESGRSNYAIPMIDQAGRVMMMSATPADSWQAIYYLHRAGLFPKMGLDQVLNKLGLYEAIDDRGRSVWRPLGGVSTEQVAQRFERIFERLTSEGLMIKHELSMDGYNIHMDFAPLPPDAREVEQFITARLTEANQDGDILMHLRRQLEPFKIDRALALAQGEIAAGRPAVIAVGRVNEGRGVNVRKWDEMEGAFVKEQIHTSEGTIKTLRERVKSLGLRVGEISGGVKEQQRNKAMLAFQRNELDLLLLTAEAGGVGVNLGDAIGDKPRTMIVLTPPFSGDAAVQLLGRIWRLTTKTDARAIYVMTDAEVDAWGARITAKKLRALGAIVSGELDRMKIPPLEGGAAPPPPSLPPIERVEAPADLPLPRPTEAAQKPKDVQPEQRPEPPPDAAGPPAKLPPPPSPEAAPGIKVEIGEAEPTSGVKVELGPETPIDEQGRDLTPAPSAPPKPPPPPPAASQGATKGRSGAASVVRTPTNVVGDIETRFEVHEAGDVRTSFQEGYPREKQPRNTKRAASEDTIEWIARKLDPSSLGEARISDSGAPIIDPEGNVEVGNHRVEALRRAYAGPQGQKYKDWLMSRAAALGLDPDAIASMAEPVLVRRRVTSLDPQKTLDFVRDSNAPVAATMSPAETARSDAAAMGQEVMTLFKPDMDLLSKANRPFVNAFMENVVPTTQHGSLRDTKGDLGKAWLSRIKNALFAQAYGTSDALERAIESTEDNVKNLVNGMTAAVPEMARLRKLLDAGVVRPLDPAPAIGQALDRMSKLREEGKSVEKYLFERGAEMFGIERELTHDGAVVLKKMDKYARSSASFGRLLKAYADVMDTLGDPTQTTFVKGARDAVTVGDVFKAADDKISGETVLDLFEATPAGPKIVVPPEPKDAADLKAKLKTPEQSAPGTLDETGRLDAEPIFDPTALEEPKGPDGKSAGAAVAGPGGTVVGSGYVPPADSYQSTPIHRPGKPTEKRRFGWADKWTKTLSELLTPFTEARIMGEKEAVTDGWRKVHSVVTRGFEDYKDVATIFDSDARRAKDADRIEELRKIALAETDPAIRTEVLADPRMKKAYQAQARAFRMAKRLIMEHRLRVPIARLTGRATYSGSYLHEPTLRAFDMFSPYELSGAAPEPSPAVILDRIAAKWRLEGGETQNIGGHVIAGWGLKDYFPHVWADVSAHGGGGLVGGLNDIYSAVRGVTKGIVGPLWKHRIASHVINRGWSPIMKNRSARNLMQRLQDADGFSLDPRYNYSVYLEEVAKKIIHERVTSASTPLIFGEHKAIGFIPGGGFDLGNFARDLFNNAPTYLPPMEAGGKVMGAIPHEFDIRLKTSKAWDLETAGGTTQKLDAATLRAMRWHLDRRQTSFPEAGQPGDPVVVLRDTGHGFALRAVGLDNIKKLGVLVRKNSLFSLDDAGAYEEIHDRLAKFTGYDRRTDTFRYSEAANSPVGRVIRGALGVIKEIADHAALGGVFNPKAIITNIATGQVTNLAAMGPKRFAETTAAMRGHIAFNAAWAASNFSFDALPGLKRRFANTPFVKNVLPVLEAGHALKFGNDEMQDPAYVRGLRGGWLAKMRAASFASFMTSEKYVRDFRYYAGYKEALEHGSVFVNGTTYRVHPEYVEGTGIKGQETESGYGQATVDVSAHDYARSGLYASQWNLEWGLRPKLMRLPGWKLMAHLGTVQSLYTMQLYRDAYYTLYANPKTKGFSPWTDGNTWTQEDKFRGARFLKTALGYGAMIAAAKMLFDQDMSSQAGPHPSDVAPIASVLPMVHSLPWWVRLYGFTAPTDASMPLQFAGSMIYRAGEGITKAVTTDEPLDLVAKHEWQKFKQDNGGLWMDGPLSLAGIPFSRTGRKVWDVIDAERTLDDPDRPYVLRGPSGAQTRRRSGFELWSNIVLPGSPARAQEERRQEAAAETQEVFEREQKGDVRRLLLSSKPEEVARGKALSKKFGYTFTEKALATSSGLKEQLPFMRAIAAQHSKEGRLRYTLRFWDSMTPAERQQATRLVFGKDSRLGRRPTQKQAKGIGPHWVAAYMKKVGA